DADVRGGQGYAIARDILDSGRAMKKMHAIIEAQGRQTQSFAPGTLTEDILAPASGYVNAISNLMMARIARLAGAPMDKGAGVRLFKKLGDRVTKGEPLYRIHAQFPADFNFARQMALEKLGYEISTQPQGQEDWEIS